MSGPLPGRWKRTFVLFEETHPGLPNKCPRRKDSEGDFMVGGSAIIASSDHSSPPYGTISTRKKRLVSPLVPEMSISSMAPVPSLSDPTTRDQFAKSVVVVTR